MIETKSDKFHFSATNLKCSCGSVFQGTGELIDHIDKSYVQSKGQGDLFKGEFFNGDDNGFAF